MTAWLWIPLIPAKGGHPGTREEPPLNSDVEFLGTEEGLEPLFVVNSLALERPGSPTST